MGEDLTPKVGKRFAFRTEAGTQGGVNTTGRGASRGK